MKCIEETNGGWRYEYCCKDMQFNDRAAVTLTPFANEDVCAMRVSYIGEGATVHNVRYCPFCGEKIVFDRTPKNIFTADQELYIKSLLADQKAKLAVDLADRDKFETEILHKNLDASIDLLKEGRSMIADNVSTRNTVDNIMRKVIRTLMGIKGLK